MGDAMTETAFALLTPSNNSGALALARATFDGTTLRVDVVASGLAPGEVHPFHIHGFLDDSPERLAVAADDIDGDGRVESPEGGPLAIGPVITALTASGDALFGVEVSADFPVAAADGALRFSQTYELDPAVADDAQILERLTARFEGRVIQFHGLDVPPGVGAGTPGEVNGTGGYIPGLPVAAGQLLGPGGELDPRTAEWLASDSAEFLDRGAAALSLLAPYSLNSEGTGPAAEEPPGAATPPTDTYAALLAPSNGSGALGVSLVTLDRADTSVTVELVMTGLTPEVEHASHIHGFADDSRSLLPNFRLDADADGFVEDDEGEPVVGPVILALTEDGTISNASTGLDFPDADASGAFRLSRTYDFDESDPAQVAIFEELVDRLTGREVQVHGLFVPETEGEGTPGEVDGTAGYKDVLPVANGILLPATDADAAQDFAALGRSLEKLLAGGSAPADSGETAEHASAGHASKHHDGEEHWFL
jgi:hypothetical protein